jgi:translation initiation factor RLI1
MKPMKIDPIIDQDVQFLSGGELQRVAMALALGKPSDVYLIDEPSAYLDRWAASSVPSFVSVFVRSFVRSFLCSFAGSFVR